MTTSCPNGHDSEWPDWCSVCGERLGDVAVAAEAAPVVDAPAPLVSTPPQATGPTCDNCGVPRHEHDVFCESCGYDFASGSLPEGSDPQEVAPDAAPLHAKLIIDADFFAASVGDVELALPDPLPDVQLVPLPGIRILIGRQSTSRGIFPEIDVRALTDDPAVSSRHAMLERGIDGIWTLTDLGSTNGSFLTATADPAIAAGTALPITPGTSIYLGAWTRIELNESTS